MHDLQMGHRYLVHLRVEDRTARNIQVVRIGGMALDMAIGLGVALDIGVELEAYPYPAPNPSSRAHAQFLSSYGVELLSHIRSSV